MSVGVSLPHLTSPNSNFFYPGTHTDTQKKILEVHLRDTCQYSRDTFPSIN